VALFYLVKLVREERESHVLGVFLDEADIVSSDLVLAELPRAMRRAVADDPKLSLDELIEQTSEVLDAIATAPVDEAMLITAGGLPEPALRTLDAIHVATALTLSPVDGFVSYDERQSAAARLAGLRTVTPSEPTVQPDNEEVVELSEPTEVTVRSIRDHGE
jgi:predicted nucleic acid-binding protein